MSDDTGVSDGSADRMGMIDRSDAERRSDGPADDEYAALAALIDELAETTEELRDRAADADIPAVERNAKRVDATVTMLQRAVPKELHERDADERNE